MNLGTNLDSSVYGQKSMSSSAENDLPSIAQHDHPHSASFSSHGTKRRHFQSTEPSLEPDPKRSNEANASCSTDSEELLHRLERAILLIKVLQDKIQEKDMSLKQKQTECEQKDKNLGVYLDFINNLEGNCNEKIKQLAEKDIIIDQLKLKVIEKDNRLSAFNNQSNSNVTNEPQEKCTSKDAELVEMKSKIKRLEKEVAKQSTQLQENSSTINKLQTQSGNKDLQLAEGMDLVEQLKSQCVEIESQMQPTSEELENLEENIDNFSSCFQALFNCADICRKNKQYVKAIIHYETCTAFEKSTQNRPDELANLFVCKAFCYLELKNYQKVIDAATSALQYEPQFTTALYNRAFSYFNLKQYSNARQDLEIVLHLDSADGNANRLLKQLQVYINEATTSSQA